MLNNNRCLWVFVAKSYLDLFGLSTKTMMTCTWHTLLHSNPCDMGVIHHSVVDRISSIWHRLKKSFSSFAWIMKARVGHGTFTYRKDAKVLNSQYPTFSAKNHWAIIGLYRTRRCMTWMVLHPISSCNQAWLGGTIPDKWRSVWEHHLQIGEFPLRCLNRRVMINYQYKTL